MGLRYLGNIIRPGYNPLASNITTGVNTAQYQGVFTLQQQAQAQNTQSWTTDPLFDLTTMLIQSDNTVNGAQNNTFLDSSSNNFSITRNGNATQGNFTPFSPGWSIFLDGTSLINTPAGLETAFAGWGGRTRTWECWVYRSSAADYTLQSAYTAVSQSDRWYISITSNKLRFAWTTAVASETFVSTDATIPTGWVYLSVTIDATTASSATIYLGINGRVQTFSGNNLSTQTTSDPWQALFGAAYNQQNLTGYFTGLRWSNNLRYTANYAVPTQPLINDANTLFLFGQGNRFLDQSSNNYTITVNAGVPAVQAFSPFAPQFQWTPTVIGGSGYFDGSGDFLSVADNANLRLGTSAFTIQAWIFRSAANVAHSIIAKGTGSTGFVFQVTSGNVLRFTHTTTNVDTTTTIPAGSWTHVAAVRTSTGTNGFQLYINGVSSATATVATNLNQTDTLYVGADRSAATTMNGFISGLKYTNGTAESISIPTAPPTQTANVALLMNFTNAGIYDGTMKNALETVGNVSISTSVVRYGSGSMYFDGSGDYVKVVGTPGNIGGTTAPVTSGGYTFGTGPFTFEVWVNLVSVSTGPVIIDSNTGTQGVGRFLVDITSGGVVSLRTGTGAVLAAGGNVALNTWQHIAITRDAASAARVFVNGTLVNTANSITTDFNMKPTDRPFIGINAFDASSQAFNGYMDEMRITNGVARYVTNFTPPTVALPRQ